MGRQGRFEVLSEEFIEVCKHPELRDLAAYCPGCQVRSCKVSDEFLTKGEKKIMTEARRATMPNREGAKRRTSPYQHNDPDGFEAKRYYG